MALRQILILLPTDRISRLEQLLDEARCIDRWHTPVDEHDTLSVALLRGGDIESLNDALHDEFRNAERFRVTLLAVEATTPKAEEDATESEQAENKPTWASRLGRVSREELLEDVQSGAKAGPIFIIMTLLSTLVACVGLTKDSPAIIIGAMVIAPLLGPNMALALGCTLGDLTIIRQSIIANLAGIAIALIISVVYGALLIDAEPNSEIIARTSVDLSDILLALASGAAGAIALSSGAAGTLVGVMVAVALLPPTAACGMLLGLGEPGLAGRAATLTMTNVACINLSATGVFLFQGVRPNLWWEKDRAKRASIRAVAIWTIVLAALATLIVLVGPG